MIEVEAEEKAEVVGRDVLVDRKLDGDIFDAEGLEVEFVIAVLKLGPILEVVSDFPDVKIVLDVCA